MDWPDRNGWIIKTKQTIPTHKAINATEAGSDNFSVSLVEAGSSLFGNELRSPRRNHGPSLSIEKASERPPKVKRTERLETTKNVLKMDVAIITMTRLRPTDKHNCSKRLFCDKYFLINLIVEYPVRKKRRIIPADRTTILEGK